MDFFKNQYADKGQSVLYFLTYGETGIVVSSDSANPVLYFMHGHLSGIFFEERNRAVDVIL